MKNTRNGAIDVYKFFFSLMIAFFHFYSFRVSNGANKHLPLGSLAVEFYVLAAGIFFYRGWDRIKSTNQNLLDYPLHYYKKRFLRFLPFTLPAFVFAALINRVILYTLKGGTLTPMKLFKWFSGDIWEILLIKMNGLNNEQSLINGPSWTISAMLIVEFFIICLLVNWEHVFITFICPISIIVGYGCWRHIVEAGPKNWIGFTTFGVFRVYLIMCCAYFCYQISKNLERVTFTKTGKLTLTAIEFLGYGLTVFIAEYCNSRNFKWLATLIFVFVLAITASGTSHSKEIFKSSKITNYLGELSLGIYLSHYPIIQMFGYFYSDLNDMYRQKYVFLACILGAGMLLMWIGKGLKMTGSSFFCGYLKAKLVKVS